MDFKKEINRLTLLPVEREMSASSNEIILAYTALKKNLSRFDKTQREISMQLDEISGIVDDYKQIDIVQETLAESKLETDNFIKSLLNMFDLIEDFYIFSLDLQDEHLLAQASIIFNKAIKALNTSGLVKINDTLTSFDPTLNTVVDTSSDTSFENGAILKTLRSGFIYKNKVLRKSSVLVNKL